MRGITLLNYNFKGGVGKTTLTGMQGYILSKQNKKVLFVDFDPQANLTQMISTTFKKRLRPDINLLNGLDHGDLSHSIVHASKNLDIIPCDWNLSLWPTKIEKYSMSDRHYVLSKLLKPFKYNYDYIFIDVPPTLTEFVMNAIFAADGISIVLQTQKMSYQSALLTAKELYTLRKQFNLKFSLLGVILYLFQNAKVDRKIKSASRKIFGSVIYRNEIWTQERVKGFTDTGIRERDFWDSRAISMYNLLNNEIMKRVRKMIING